MRYNCKTIMSLSIYSILAISVNSCNTQTHTNGKSISIDKAFASLFYADSGGISGADGVFSVLLPDSSSVFFLGDCFIGEVINGSRDLKTPMLRNAFNLIDKNKRTARAIVRGSLTEPLTLMEPYKAKGDSTYRWYWPGHGFAKGDTLYVFALNLYNDSSARVKSNKPENEQNEADKLAEDMFSFRISQIDLLSFKLPDFKHIETHKVDFDYTKYPIDFGNCVMIDNGYVYIYGTKNLPGFSKIHAARIPLNSNTFYKGWEYYTDKGWDYNIEKSTPIAIDISVSEQFSIFKYKDKYILLTMERAGFDIYTYTSNSPIGPFTNKKFIYHTPEHEADSTMKLFTYNALAHPQYIENDELLVSYCINSLNVKDVFDNVENYRARFIRVPIQMILE